MPARREGKLVKTALSDCPFVEGVPRALDFARVHGVAPALLVELVCRWPGTAHELVVVNVDVATGVGDEKASG